MAFNFYISSSTGNVTECHKVSRAVDMLAGLLWEKIPIENDNLDVTSLAWKDAWDALQDFSLSP
jgi:hypothetical protein